MVAFRARHISTTTDGFSRTLPLFFSLAVACRQRPIVYPHHPEFYLRKTAIDRLCAAIPFHSLALRRPCRCHRPADERPASSWAVGAVSTLATGVLSSGAAGRGASLMSSIAMTTRYSATNTTKSVSCFIATAGYNAPRPAFASLKNRVVIVDRRPASPRAHTRSTPDHRPTGCRSGSLSVDLSR